MEINTVYEIQNTVALKPGLLIRAGSKMKLVGEMSLSPVQVFLFQFKLISCPSSIATQKTEMVIVKGKYGVELNLGCAFDIYVEAKDYYQSSLLRPALPAASF